VSRLLQTAGVEQTRLPGQPLHLAVGMFDGLHRGHQSVIGAARQAAAADGGLTGVLTFWPHPSALFRPESPTALLMTPAIKRSVLEGLGVDVLIEQEFTRKFASLEAEAFVPWLRGHLPGLVALYVGENWRYGRNRRGDAASLSAQAQAVGLQVIIVPRLKELGEPVSSSRIRELLAAGEMEQANALLGYHYFSVGVVEQGRQLGRTIGFPTLNLAWEPDLKPRFGVYAVRVVGGGSPPLQAVANYGVRPTVGQGNRPLLEVHLLEPATLTYGDQLTVDWLHFLRPETKFGDFEALRQQIEKDVVSARDFFSKKAVLESPKDA
jgi:riboflavin kinase / FMN adenylyltransferase